MEIRSSWAKFYKSRRSFFLALIIFVAPAFVGQTARAQNSSASVTGKVTVTSSEGEASSLAGITVMLTGPAPDTTSRSTQTDADGHYEFTHLAPGTYFAEASLEGFNPWTQTIALGAGQAATVDAPLQIHTMNERVEVQAEATEIATESVSATATVSEKQLDALPLRTQELAEALSLSPAVIRTHEGKLNFNGQTESQGMLLVDSAENVDPVAGSFAIPVPVGVIQSVQVYNTPDSAEFGGFSGGLTRIELKPPPQTWNYKLLDFIPAFRAKNDHLLGIANITPRLQFGGPIVDNKYSFYEDLTYEYRRDPVRGLSWPYNETYKRSFISFTEFQATFSQRHVMNFNVNFFPQNLQFIDISALIPQSAAVDYRRRGVSAGISDTYQFESGIILNTVVRYTRFDSSTFAQGSDVMQIIPEGWRGNFFNNWARKANQFEALPTVQLPTKSWLGRHDLKFGTDVLYRTYGGDSVSHPIQIRGEGSALYATDGPLIEQIDFQGPGILSATSKEISEFAEDRWAITNSFSINFGGRVTSQSTGRSLAFAPRGGLAYALRGGKTVVRAGAGVLYGHVPLLAAGFANNQQRVITTYNCAGGTACAPITLQNLYLPAGTSANSPGSQIPGSTPRTLSWNAEVESAVRSNISIRVGYLETRTRDLFIVDPLLPTSGTLGVLALTNTGTSQYRQAEMTAHYKPSERADVNFTYVWSRARGDLNALTDTFVPVQSPVIRPNAYGISSSDVPQRFIASGVFDLPFWKLNFSPLVDLHSGFPYSPLDGFQNYAATPNSLRFPTYFSLDAKIYRDFIIHIPFLDSRKGRKVRLGVFSLNMTSHQNPHDVFYTNTSPLSGVFDGFPRRFTGFVLGLGQ